MRIVAVTARATHPATRGDITRLLGFLGELASRHEVACCAPAFTAPARAALAAIGVEPVVADRRLPSPRRIAALPVQVAAATGWSVTLPVARDADILHLSTVRAAALVDESDLSRAHLDHVDALSAGMAERARSSALRPLWHREARRLRSFEAALAVRVRSSSCTSTSDRELLPGDVAVVPNGVTPPRSVGQPDAEPTILFPGNLGYFANVDAAAWLAEEILPLVRRRVPRARLLVVGARPNRRVRALGGLGGVSVLGDVASMSGYYARAWIVVAPLRLGTGVQNKVLEGFAHRRAVVTTSPVAGRLPATGRAAVAAADDAPGLADAIVRLLQDEAERDELAEQGLAVAHRCTWKAATEELERVYCV